MQTTAAHSTGLDPIQEARRHYRVERRFFSKRRIKDLVRDLLRAHCGE